MCVPGDRLYGTNMLFFSTDSGQVNIGSVSQPVVPSTEASVSSENLQEMQILMSHSRATESETLGMKPSNIYFDKP